MIRKIKKYSKELFLKILINLIPPMKSADTSESIGIVTLLCHNDVDRFICAATSLMYFLKKTLPIHIINDGTLGSSDFRKLSEKFTIIIDGKNQLKIKNMHSFSRYRLHSKTAKNKKKIDALLFSKFLKSIYIDADVLFFKEPVEIKKFLKKNDSTQLFNSRRYDSHLRFPFLIENELYSLRKLFYMYIFKKEITSKIPSNIYFNSGLMCIKKIEESDFEFIESIFKLFEEVHFERNYLAEEIAFSLIFASKKATALPHHLYTVVSDWEEYQTLDFSKVVSVHYSADRGMKTKNTSDAIRLLIKTNCFQKKHLL